MEAVDGGGVSSEPPRKTEVSVTVRLEDINDNAPKFERDSYSIEFSEDAKIGKDGDTNSGKIITVSKRKLHTTEIFSNRCQ